MTAWTNTMANRKNAFRMSAWKAFSAQNSSICVFVDALLSVLLFVLLRIMLVVLPDSRTVRSGAC